MLKDVLRKRSRVIRERCLAAFAAVCPAWSCAPASAGQDRFHNPVGHTLTEALDRLLNDLFDGDREGKETKESMRDAVRILAVQDVPPSKALSFIPLLKDEIRRELPDGSASAEDSDALRVIEARLDEALMEAFDLYMEFKEQIARVRINEVKAEKERLARLLAAVGGGERREPQ